MRRLLIPQLTLAVALLHTSALAQSISALASFGGGDGWLAPGEGGITYLTTGDTQRGMAYGNGHLYVVNRNVANSIVRLDGTTGANLGSPLSLSGVSGGTFAINKIGVAGDGKVYVGNLATAMSNTAPYKIYSWANDAATPTVAYTGVTLANARMGDSTLAVSGTGSSTRLYSGFAASPAIAGNNGYAVIDPTAGTHTAVSFVGTPPAAGDFRLGLTVGPAGQVWGLQGSQTLRETTFSGSSGTLLGTGSGLVSIAERPMSFAVINGLPVVATISTGDSAVRIYDASNPLALQLMLTKNNTTGTLTANGNGTGDVAWGDSFYNGDGTSTATLYTLSSNQGIQAFTVIIPEPGTFSLAVLGLGAFGLRRKLKK